MSDLHFSAWASCTQLYPTLCCIAWLGLHAVNRTFTTGLHLEKCLSTEIIILNGKGLKKNVLIHFNVFLKCKSSVQNLDTKSKFAASCQRL